MTRMFSCQQHRGPIGTQLTHCTEKLPGNYWQPPGAARLGSDRVLSITVVRFAPAVAWVMMSAYCLNKCSYL